jgi:predicted DNA-binding protein
VDGRTLRVRQDTLDRTMVTSMRLAVSTIEQLDEFCWRYRRRKQDVVQEALELYFQAVAEEEGEG